MTPKEKLAKLEKAYAGCLEINRRQVYRIQALELEVQELRRRVQDAK